MAIFSTRKWDNTHTRAYNERMQLHMRRVRAHVLGFNHNHKQGLLFNAGDIIAAVVERGPYGHFIEGICISISKRAFIQPHTSILVRNIIEGVGVEFSLAYYYNRIYKLQMRDYKRKQFDYVNSNKLYYLRHRNNRESRVFK